MASQLFRAGARALRQAANQAPAIGAPAARSAVPQVMRPAFQQTRGMAGAPSGEGMTHAGLTLHKPAAWHTYVGTGMATMMWLWIMYRAKQDGEVFLYGHAVHFEHDDDEEHEEH